MTATIYNGPYTWSLDRDSKGHRTYTVEHRVHTSNVEDGPQVVMNTPGLPVPGAMWNLGNDVDTWAFCTPEMSVRIHEEKTGDPNREWIVSQKFTTISLKRCQTQSIENPLLEPQGISGTFVKSKVVAKKDKDGKAIEYTNHQPIEGPAVEFVTGQPTVDITQNLTVLGLAEFARMVDTVNQTPMWGLGSRKIRLANVTWERKIYGKCNYYFTRKLHFEINYDGWDREILNAGTKVLHGRWQYGTWVLLEINGAMPDPDNPAHFMQVPDMNGTPIKMLLDADGKPLNSNNPDDYVYVSVKYYKESNFALLGIPMVLA